MMTDDFAANDKTGSLMTAIGHIFCAVVGAGVLGLPYSLAWLGWVAGPILLVFFYVVSLWTAKMLADVYAFNGVEHARYHHAVLHILGNRVARWATVFQCFNLVLVCIAYTITGASAMHTAAQRMGSSFSTKWAMTVLMGGIELIFSQLPNFEKIWWVSAIGAATSLCYCTIALILGCVYAGNGYGSVGGLPGSSTADKVFQVLNALGDLAFAYSFSMVLLEIQDTLKQPPQAAKTMKKAMNVAITGAFAFYLSVAVTGYAALGLNEQTMPGEVLEGFTDAPAWPVIIANLAIAVHMISAYQIFAQPMFDTVESHIKAFIIKREKKRAGLNTTNTVGAGATSKAAATLTATASASAGSASKLDAPNSHPHHHHQPSPFDAITEPSVGVQELASNDMDKMEEGGLVVQNSAPPPDLVPEKGWVPTHIRKRFHDDASEADLTTQGMVAQLGTALGSQCMCHLDTGAANEHVPLNDQGYFMPLYMRLITRTTFVFLVTLVAVLMPSFSAVVGLVGSVSFFPLSIFFPMAMWIKVFKPTGNKLKFMYAIGSFMLVIAIAAVIASCRSLIVLWSSNFHLF